LTTLDRPELRDETPEPWTPPECSSQSEDDIFTVIRREDRLLYHPFQTFTPIVDLLRKAAHDPEVLAIKMTLYRVGRSSPIVKALLEAIEYGKQLAVLLELKARFDEESNIEWARALEREGVHVVYGLLGLKVHCKIALIVRRSMTISGATCIWAPATITRLPLASIRREISYGQRGRLILKMNALEDKAIIRLLYEASRAGVRVDLIVRGLCCLRPSIVGVSEIITVRSIVGRFLEHSRVIYFGNDGKEEMYAGSADLMPRNLDRRVELLFPIINPKIVRYLRDVVLEKYLADNRKARIGKPDGNYETMRSGSLDSQAWFLSHRTSQADSEVGQAVSPVAMWGRRERPMPLTLRISPRRAGASARRGLARNSR
jgi:polyphosphate kinase